MDAGDYHIDPILGFVHSSEVEHPSVNLHLGY